MKHFYADLHIHIGKNNAGQRVKMMAANDLTFAHIAEEALTRKGLDLIGIVDCASFLVATDIEAMLATGEVQELAAGGLLYQGKLVILLGSEVELSVGHGSAHLLVYFPFWHQMKQYGQIMAEQYVKNPNLSTQKAYLTIEELFDLVTDLGGILIPAHAFTPHKGIYGNCLTSLQEVLPPEKAAQIPALELGLSADTFLADQIAETATKNFLSNSDAHSLAKIGREYNVLSLEKLNYAEFLLALGGQEGRRIVANYGLDPQLGKYHRTFCLHCERIVEGKAPLLVCDRCGGKKVVIGVLDRIKQIADRQEGLAVCHRPVYHYQIPLDFVPGVGKKTLDKLIASCGSEMAVLHRASPEEICAIVGAKIGNEIVLAREGRLHLQAGGGGTYGKVVSSH